MLIQPPMRIIGRTLVTFPFIMSVSMVGSVMQRVDARYDRKGKQDFPSVTWANYETARENSPSPPSMPYLLFSTLVKYFAVWQRPPKWYSLLGLT